MRTSFRKEGGFANEVSISMQAIPIRIFLIIIILFLFYPHESQPATEQRIALVIGNSAYSSGPLKNPVNDATAMAAMLKKLGFSVTLQKNAKQQEMDESIRDFGRRLKRARGVGLFYYAGHGIQIGGVNYLLPVNARIEKESDVRFQSVNADTVLAEMENAENELNIVILDACRDNPFSRSFRNVTRGLAIIGNAPSGTFISYSTGANQVARDGDGKNSPYTRALLENMDKPGLSLNNVFMKVRSKVKKETGQIPWELSSLEGDFYFVPGSPSKSTVMVPTMKTTVAKDESSVSETAVTDAFDEESRMEKKKALEEKRRQIEEDKAAQEAKKTTALAMAKRPTVSMVREIKKDGRFIAYDDGTVLDANASLIWAAKDNGSNINWENAKSYCENYRGGGYSDWRMPTQDELAGLHDASKNYQSECRGPFGGKWDLHLSELIRLTCIALWASETRGTVAAYFRIDGDGRGWTSGDENLRALPVRSAK